MGAREGTFCPGLACHIELLSRQLIHPLGGGLSHLGRFVFRVGDVVAHCEVPGFNFHVKR